MRGFVRATSMSIFPMSFDGRPFVRRDQVSPPSVDLKRPPSVAGPPLMMSQPLRNPRYIPAYSSLGFAGLIASTRAPVELLTKRVFFHVLPPSIVLNSPRSSFGPKGEPSAATQTMSGFVGWTITLPICPASGSPVNCHVRPASTDLYTPRPMITLLLMAALPVPTQTTFGLESATAIAPIEPVAICPSLIGFHR